MKPHALRHKAVLSILAAIMISVSFPGTMSGERRWLVTSHDQLSTNPTDKDKSKVSKIGLTDGDDTKDGAITDSGKTLGGEENEPWESADLSGDPADRNYIQVKLNEPLSLKDGEALVVYSKRHTVNALCHPTGFQICAGNDGETWTTVGYAYLLYRGINTREKQTDSTLKGTKEYSARVYVNTDSLENVLGEIKYLRFYVTANNTKERVRDAYGTLSDNRRMQLASFNVMQLGADDQYSFILKDRFHLVTDYSYKYYYYDFEPTLGIFDKRNQYQPNSSDDYHSINRLLNGFTKYPGEPGSPWEEFSDASGSGIRWNKDLDFLKVAGIEMPTYTRLTNAQDSRISRNDKIPGTDTDNWRQPVHEMVHELYAIPGDPIALYPFYPLGDENSGNSGADKNASSYGIKFIHWYNYRTGGNSPYLDFLIDPSLICKSENYGYYAGSQISTYTKTDPNDNQGGSGGGSEEPTEPETIKIGTVEEYLDFVSKVNGGETGMKAELTSDLDFKEVEVKPIGTAAHPFNGSFDGKGHVISNMVMNSSDSENIGMFGYAKGCIIKNIYIDSSCSFSGKNNIGFIGTCHIAKDAPVTTANIVSEATISSEGNAGGIIGNWVEDGGTWTQHLIISDCSFRGTIKNAKCYGGIGHVSWCDIKNSFSTASFPNNAPSNGAYFVNIPTDHWTWTDAPIVSSNNFSNVLGEYDMKDAASINRIYNNENGYYVKISDEDIYINTEDFAKILGKEWCLDEKLGLVPFVTTREEQKPKPVDPENPDEPKPELVDYDQIPDLEDVRKAIYGSLDSNNDPANSTYPLRAFPYKIGTAATFFFPRRTTTTLNGEVGPLPADPDSPGDDKDFLIVADMSTIFNNKEGNNDLNVDRENKVIGEPTVIFRHIFRIKDGKEFAEDFSGSPEKNKEYVRRNRQIISARQTKSFQIRLDCPVPVMKDGELPPPSKYYYKISDSDYRRVRSFELEAFHADENWNQGKKVNKSDEIDFNFDISALKFPGMGSRTFDEATYNICGGGGYYSRMIYCEGKDWTIGGNLPAGNYLLRLIPLDINGNRIKVYGGSEGETLVLKEYNITILPESKASMRTMKDALEKDEEGNLIHSLRAKYKKPVAEINFDNYSHLMKDMNSGETSFGITDKNDYLRTYDNSAEGYFKWPLPWDEVSYGFGYSMEHQNGGFSSINQIADYNYDIYLISNNLKHTPFHEAIKDERKYDVTYYIQEALGKENPEKGFFYWINSASDPCVAARLSLGDICAGSTIHASVWMIECSTLNETANISFNFMAVTTDGDRIPVHSFKTGYIPAAGEWYNVRYEFMPDFDRINGIREAGKTISHYEMELENNCKNSEAADYAIDQIELYVVSPEVKAKQLEPLCDAESYTLVKIELPIDQFLASLGVDEVKDAGAASDINVFYAFLDKDVFDTELPKSGYESAFSKALLRYAYDGKNDHDQTFGKLSFSNFLTGNTPYPENGDGLALTDHEMVGKLYYDEASRSLVVIARPENEKQFATGQEYYIAILMDDSGEITEPSALDFELNSGCSYKGVFTVESANKTIITPGASSYDTPSTGYCLGTSPVIDIEINNIKAPSGKPSIIEGAALDWYAGSKKEFDSEKMADGTRLEDVLLQFRHYNPSTSDLPNAETNDNFTETMREWLIELTKKKHPDGRPMLRLGTTTYQFTPGKLIITPGDSINYVTALPYLPDGIKENDNLIFCSAPIEVRLKASPDSPAMTHGFDIPYPDELIDVPIRMSKQHISKAKDNDNTLRVPVLKVSTPSALATRLRLRQVNNSEYTNVHLLDTDDPIYAGLTPASTPSLSGDDDILTDDDLFLTVGHIAALHATKTNGSPLPDNAFYVKFDEITTREGESKLFEFHEGYFYTMKFDLEEAAEGLNSKACPGQHIFTIKVVPEYLVWNGAEPTDNGLSAEGKSLNWNNDSNWSRITETEAVPGSEYSAPSDGNASAFAPLDFTKVIIGDSRDFPRMYHVEDIAVEGTDLPTHLWSRLPDAADITGPYYSDNAPANDAGDPTRNIHFDLVAYTDGIPAGKFTEPEIGVAVSCRPWYANTTGEINFRPNSEIFAQQHLRYGKAWVEMEFVPGKWHTLASPLQKVYAGDMYLPTAGARQMNRFFTEIEFDNTLKTNNRFNPAVYQRSWNLASDKTTIYEEDGSTRYGFVSLDWSNVFNEVEVDYAAGEGFSIKADAEKAEKVLFRFPKEDTEYHYFTHDGIDKGITGSTPRGEGHGKLNPTHGEISIAANGESRFFLVGNPFMAHIDMAEFIRRNSDRIEPKYWILNGDRQSVTIIDSDGIAISSDNDGGGTLLPPLSGFFVKAKDAAQTLTLSYDEEMMSVALNPSAATRGYVPADFMRVRAIGSSLKGASALLLADGGADAAILPGEDAELLKDPNLDDAPCAYTVADGMALSINSLPDLEGVEVGVTARNGDSVTLRFEGPLCDAGYYLRDTESGTLIELHDGLEIPVEGSVKGRFFITAGIVGSVTSGITISCNNGIATVISGADLPVEVKVCDVAGRNILHIPAEEPLVKFRLPEGVVIVSATDSASRATRKFTN